MTFQGDVENESVQRRDRETKEKSKKRRRTHVKHIKGSESQTCETTSVKYVFHSHAIYDYFPLAMEHMFGPIHIPNSLTDSYTSKLTTFPHNLTFRTADWVDQVIPEDKDMYDIVIA